MGLHESLGKVKEILDNITAARQHQDIVVTKTLFIALGDVLEAANVSEVSVLIANTTLSVLEEVYNGKIVLSRCLQTIIVSIYSCIIAKAPGYAVRNIAVACLALCGNKSTPTHSKECALSICGAVLATRSFDCGSMISDSILTMAKLIKASDIQLRLAAIKLLITLVAGAGVRIGDCHPDIIKLITKYVTDKSTEVRLNVALLITAIAKNSSGCISVTTEVLLSVIGKGLEDEVATVQDAFTRYSV
jgi:hypothetical protein